MECAEVISGIQILHVFGQLDDLDWQNPTEDHITMILAT